MNKIIYSLISTIIILFSTEACTSSEGMGISNNLQRTKGNSIQIDPVVLNTSGITAEELIADLKKADINSVHYFIVSDWDGSKDDNLFKEEYINALKENNIGIWFMLLGNCFYGNTSLPDEWKMELLSPYPGNVNFFSFHNENFVNWQVERVKRIIKNYPYLTGIEFAESYFPEWKTIDKNGFYGDVSSNARKIFAESYLDVNDSIPTFNEIRNNSELYKEWQNFRVEAIIHFNLRIKETIKNEHPDILFASWGMGMRNAKLEEIREHFGLDMIRLANEVKPDILFIQTSAQDWGDQSLAPQYLNDYNYIVEALKKANPEILLGVQADIASLSYHDDSVPKRDGSWWKTFMELSSSAGYFTNTAYEYAFYKKQGLWIEE
jgi:hypothetical protein